MKKEIFDMSRGNPMDGLFKMVGAFGPVFNIIAWMAMFSVMVYWATVILPTDLETTRLGYLRTETVKVNAEATANALTYIVFFLQISGMFGFLRSNSTQRGKWLGTMALGACIYDVFTDTVSKLPSQYGGSILAALQGSPEIVIQAFAETIIIFTIMSEIMAALFLEEMIDKFPEFTQSIIHVGKQIIGPVGHTIKTALGEDEGTYQKPIYPQQRQAGMPQYPPSVNPLRSSGQQQGSHKCANPQCGNQAPNGDRYCRKCAKEIQAGNFRPRNNRQRAGIPQNERQFRVLPMTMVNCPNCGTPLNGNNVCQNCGTQIGQVA